MNDLVKRWLEALRSGEYKQGRGMLRSQNGYCCLGVVCDLIDPEAWKTQIKRDYPYCWRSSEQQELFPVDLETSLSDTELDMLGLDHDQQESLMDMNDNGYSFYDIADEIEKMMKENDSEDFIKIPVG